MLVNDVSYVRKVRFRSFLGSLTITPKLINDQIFGTGVAPFQSLMLYGIEVWGPTCAEVTVVPSYTTVQGASTANHKAFSDVGIYGSRPGHVRMTLCEKDGVFINSSSTTTAMAYVTVSSPSTPPVGDVVTTIDLLVKFSGTADTELSLHVPPTTEEPMEF